MLQDHLIRKASPDEWLTRLSAIRQARSRADSRTPAEKRLIFNFRNSYQIALGAEKQFNAITVVRVGYLFDRTPVVDQSVGPLFPDSNRHSFTVGATRTRGNKEFTLFYEAMKFVHRTHALRQSDAASGLAACARRRQQAGQHQPDSGVPGHDPGQERRDAVVPV